MSKSPIFTTQHYNKIAALLGRHLWYRVRQLPPPVTVQDVGGVALVGKFVKMFAEDNELFDEDKFLEMIVKHAMEME